MAKHALQLLYPKRVDDNREITAKMLDEIIRNSNGAMRFPVAIGHDMAGGYPTDDIPAAGIMTDLRLEGQYLVGDVELQPDVEKDFQSKKYPGWSVGIVNSDALGWEMDHLALLGARGAAFKDLLESGEGATFSTQLKSSNGKNVICFGSDPNKKSWMVLSTSEPKEIIKPAAIEPAQNYQGDPNMDLEAKKKQELLAKQNEELAKQNKELQEKFAQQEKFARDGRVQEFASIKSNVIKSLADAGASKDVAEKFAATLDGATELYADQKITREMFDAFSAVVADVKSKPAPGRHTDADDDDDGWKDKKQFSAKRPLTRFTSRFERNLP